MINNIKLFITDHKKDLLFILLLTFFLVIISLPKLYSQYNIGIGNWDTFLYLENGRNFAKMGWGDVPSISPVLPMILSKLFLIAGKPYQEAIFNMDVIFYITGMITFYLLTRLKFNENVSLLGSIIFSTFTLLYSWVAIGGNDIIGMTGTLLTIYLILVAHRYNYKLYYIALPIAAYAFLSRYTAGVMIFSIIFYWILVKINVKEIKHILIGGVLGVISISWFLNNFYVHLKTPFPFLGQFSGTVSNTVVMDSGFLPDSWYYIKHVPNYLMSYVPDGKTFNAIVNPMGNLPSIVSYVYIVLFLSAFIILSFKIIKAVKKNNLLIDEKGKILLAASVLTFLLFIISLGNISYIFSILLVLLSLYLVWIVCNGEKIENLDYEMMMLSLLIIYTVFQSILFTKNDRYFITVLPFIAYFITYSVDYIFSKISKVNIQLPKIISIVVIILLLCNSLSFVNAIPYDNDYHDIEEACEWLNNNEVINNSTICYSDNWPAVTWYMNIYCQRGVPNRTDIYYPVDFSKEILTNNNSHRGALYFLDTTSPEKVDFPGMDKMNAFDTVQVYKNKYYKMYGYDYINTEEYNNRLEKEINDFNKTIRETYV